MKKKLLCSILILTVLFSTNVSAQFLRWDWWKQNPALSLIGLNNSLSPIRSGGAVVEGTFTPGFGYRNLLPSNLTSKKGISITQSDNLQYTRGSLVGGDGSGVVFESFNPNQGSLEWWVRPNWNGNDGVEYDIFAWYYDTNDWMSLVKSTNNLILLSIKYGGTLRTASNSVSSWVAGNWYHIVVVWDKNNTVDGTNYSKIYWNSTNSTGQANLLGTPGAIATSFNIGQSYFQASRFNGVIAGKLMTRPLSSTEIAARYNNGNGSDETFTVCPDTCWLGAFSY